MYHLFKDYKFVRSIEPSVRVSSVITVLCSFQFNEGTTEKATYTVLDDERGFAFSQWYKKEPNNMCSHGRMFKHELGSVNPPPIPSYHDLIQQVFTSLLPH